jgi:hypothetical protein
MMGGALIAKTETSFLMKLGRCARCMRLSLRGAMLSWAGVMAVYWTWPGSQIRYLALLVAAILTAVWLLHILTFAGRRVAAGAKIQGRAQPTRADRMDVQGSKGRRQLTSSPTRREMFGIFARGMAVGAAASILIPRQAMAKCGDCGPGYYDCITNFCGTTGQTCCPQGYPYLSHCDCKCYDGPPSDCNSYSDCHYCA